MYNYTIQEFLEFCRICNEFETAYNLLDAWSEKESLPEVRLFIERLKPYLESFQRLLRTKK